MTRIVNCVDCDATLEYSGRGRPPKRCDGCKLEEKHRASAETHMKHRDVQLVYMSARKQRNRRRIEWIKRMRGCIDCGTKKGKLEFDHRPNEIKSFNVAQGVGYSWVKIRAEIDKCDVKCGKCHRTRHMILRRENGTAPWLEAVSGEDHPQAMLTAQSVEHIRSSYHAGDFTYMQLAELYGVAKTTVGRIVRQETWQDVGLSRRVLAERST